MLPLGPAASLIRRGDKTAISLRSKAAAKRQTDPAPKRLNQNEEAPRNSRRLARRRPSARHALCCMQPIPLLGYGSIRRQIYRQRDWQDLDLFAMPSPRIGSDGHRTGSQDRILAGGICVNGSAKAGWSKRQRSNQAATPLVSHREANSQAALSLSACISARSENPGKPYVV